MLNFLLYLEVDLDFPTDEVDLFLECEFGNGLIFYIIDVEFYELLLFKYLYIYYDL